MFACFLHDSKVVSCDPTSYAPPNTEDCTWNLYCLTTGADVPARTGVNTPMIFIYLNADLEKIAAAARTADANREAQIDQDQPGWCI